MAEHKGKGKMIDNRMVHDDHGRKGKMQCDPMSAIKRVMQHGHDRMDYEGHSGSMKDGWKHGKHASHDGSRHFRRSGGPLTPRKA